MKLEIRSRVLLEHRQRGGEVVVALPRHHRNLLVQPSLHRRLEAHVERLVPRLSLVQRLDAYVSDVRAGDVVGDPVTLVEHERLVTAGLLEQLPGADDGVPEAAVAKRALAVAFRLYTKHVASSVQLPIHMRVL